VDGPCLDIADTELQDAAASSPWAGPFIAKNVWVNPEGAEFRDHYKVMERAFARGGAAAVDAVVRDGFDRFTRAIPAGKTAAESLAWGWEQYRAGRLLEARTAYLHVLHRDPTNAEAVSRLGILAVAMKAPLWALDLMRRAVALDPQSAAYRANLGLLLLRQGKPAEAEPELRKSLELSPDEPLVRANLGLALALLGKADEALAACRAAVAAGPGLALAHVRLGQALALAGRTAEARAALEAALAINPDHAEARHALGQLVAAPASP